MCGFVNDFCIPADDVKETISRPAELVCRLFTNLYKEH